MALKGVTLQGERCCLSGSSWASGVVRESLSLLMRRRPVPGEQECPLKNMSTSEEEEAKTQGGRVSVPSDRARVPTHPSCLGLHVPLALTFSGWKSMFPRPCRLATRISELGSWRL